MAPDMQSRGGQVRFFCIKNALPLGLLVALTWALARPLPGEAISTINLLIIFVISGLTLETDDIKKAMGKEGRLGCIYGVVTILSITGCLGFLVVEIPFDVKDFSYGLAVFCVVPNDLSSGITLVMNAGGNDALALLLTVTSNLLGAFTVLFFVKAVVNAGGAEFDTVDLLVKLIITVLMPLPIGKIIRETVPGARSWAKRRKVNLSLTNSFMIVMIVSQALSRGKKSLASVSQDEISYILAAGIVLHVVGAVARFITFLSNVGEEGLLMIPCIIGHLSNLFIDSYISSRWGSESEAAEGNGTAAVVGPKPRDDVEAVYAPSNGGKEPATV